MSSDGSDLRFGSDDDPTNGFELAYWIESWNSGGTSRIWVHVPAISSGSSTTIWLFYGFTGSTSSQSQFGSAFPDNYTSTDGDTLSTNMTVNAVRIQSGHTVDLPSGSVADIRAQYVVVEGTIDGVGHGFSGGSVASSGSGPGAGGGGSGCGGGGAGYGGLGGRGGWDGNETRGTAGIAYGDCCSPLIQLGSGGGGSSDTGGGDGGGGLQIYATRIHVSGEIDVSGNDGGGGTYTNGGGGSGGGVLLFGRQVGVSGTVTSDGGNGGDGNSSANDGGGGGAGGRIKLLFADFLDDSTANLSVSGGAGGIYGDASHGEPGASGRIQQGQNNNLDRPSTSVGAEQSL